MEREEIELLLSQPEILAWLELSKPEVLAWLRPDEREEDDEQSRV
jgi:hypothetical protein